ncbi:GNAT family N-acetyltransferase [Kineococcus gynurae]|uniref:GNAT family N-acetyltransferase n=1 Tax=Kineococcus gynurae TaxID=452979 RepID=A0ABV5LPP4_9ACTN
MQIRRVAPGEWELVKRLRLDALLDPAAPVAFLDTHERASRQPDAHWRDRTERAAAGPEVAQVVADDDGTWVGSVTAIVESLGPAATGGPPVRRALLVGIYVAPAHRGSGLLGRLVDHAIDWVGRQGLSEVYLEVHEQNPRAEAAYRRLGFRPTGRSPQGPHRQLVRDVPSG